MRLFAFALIVLTQPTLAAEFKVAFVDMQEAIQATSAGCASNVTIEREKKVSQRRLLVAQGLVS